MVKHVVTWKLLDYASGAARAENARALKVLLEGLRTTVPTVVDIEVGINTSVGERAWDLVLIATFRDQAGLDAYRTHPDHQAAVAFIRAVAAQSAVVDYET